MFTDKKCYTPYQKKLYIMHHIWKYTKTKQKNLQLNIKQQTVRPIKRFQIKKPKKLIQIWKNLLTFKLRN